MLKFEWNMGDRTILVQNVISIRMLKFGCKGGIHQSTEIKLKFWNQSKCWSLSEKRGIDQNVKIWGQSGESIILLKCEDKVGNWSKCWNLSKTWGINQNVEIWVQNVKSIRMLKFWCKGGNHQSIEIKWKFWNQSKCWSLSAIRWEDHNVEVWVK